MLLQLLKRRGVKSAEEGPRLSDRSMGMHVIDVNRTVKARSATTELVKRLSLFLGYCITRLLSIRWVRLRHFQEISNFICVATLR